MVCKFVTGASREQVIWCAFLFVSCLRDLPDSKYSASVPTPELYKGFISTVNQSDVCSHIKKQHDYDRIKCPLNTKSLHKPYRTGLASNARALLKVTAKSKEVPLLLNDWGFQNFV